MNYLFPIFSWILLCCIFDVIEVRKLSFKNSEESQLKGRRTLKVTGTAEMYVAPDICYVSVSLQSNDNLSAVKAYNDNVKGITEITNAVMKVGIDAIDMQTTNLNLSPQYIYETASNKQIFDRYSVSQELFIKVRDLSKVSDVLDVAVNNGATTISNIQFTIEDKSPYIEQVRDQAIESAMLKASKICQKLGSTLLNPISVTEDEDNGLDERQYFNSKLKAVSTHASDLQTNSNNIQAGSLKITHQVHILYEIS